MALFELEDKYNFSWSWSPQSSFRNKSKREGVFFIQAICFVVLPNRKGSSKTDWWMHHIYSYDVLRVPSLSSLHSDCITRLCWEIWALAEMESSESLIVEILYDYRVVRDRSSRRRFFREPRFVTAARRQEVRGRAHGRRGRWGCR